MDINSVVEGFKEFASTHPYLALAVALFILGAIIGKKAGLILYILGAIAFLEEFNLVSVLISFLKDLPGILSNFIESLGGLV